jgi:hypothetical protein
MTSITASIPTSAAASPVPGRKIHPDRAGEHDRIVSGLPERPDGLGPNQSRSTGHRHPHDRTSLCCQ